MFASVVTFVMRHHTRPADMRRYRESRSLPIGRWKGGFTGGIQEVTSVEGSILSLGLEVVDLRQETRMRVPARCLLRCIKGEEVLTI